MNNFKLLAQAFNQLDAEHKRRLELENLIKVITPMSDIPDVSGRGFDIVNRELDVKGGL